MITKITEILKDPMRPIDKKRQISARVNEMKDIKDILVSGDNIQISGGLYLLVKPTDEFKKTINEYLNNRLVELAKEVQILQGVTPIEYKESEDK
jgi:hypothetical protein|nr:MAG TPA: hypothetical protein [Caudoviricetes sp.]